MANRGPGPIPNRWLHCPRKSDSLIADKFVAFKTPLDERYNDQMTLDCIFPPEMIFSYMKMLKVSHESSFQGLVVVRSNPKFCLPPF